MLTGVLGFIFCVLYIRMGSLLLPMILHALVDLRIFLLLPNTTKVSPA
jgi:membrane protease YdiL (CAAX protease family)